MIGRILFPGCGLHVGEIDLSDRRVVLTGDILLRIKPLPNFERGGSRIHSKFGIAVHATEKAVRVDQWMPLKHLFAREEFYRMTC